MEKILLRKIWWKLQFREKDSINQGLGTRYSTTCARMMEGFINSNVTELQML